MKPPRINRSHVLWIAAIIIVLMALFPPFEVCGLQGAKGSKGYAFILTPSKESFAPPMVNTALLLTQVVIVLVVAGLAYFAIPERKQTP